MEKDFLSPYNFPICTKNLSSGIDFTVTYIFLQYDFICCS